ncbi:1,6-anhydro-N-acetylmuramyl-L-alanine amidase AmpD [Gammaproteobacteria bacterium]|nr:1,6-anhydro-N-acetylmuramyl-L-alanine amidase AmpD [Gammaproteobacteria bacterium]
MELRDHIVQGIKFLKSPNFNIRPENLAIDLLVIHSISLPPKKYGADHIEKFFLNELDHCLDPFYKEIKGLKVSSHILIKRNGEVIQFVPFNMRAWHAGESSYKGVDNCNDYSIGIELEGSDDETFDSAQYDSLCELTSLILKEYKLIGKKNIKGHSDIAPGRKLDPGILFDWERYLKNV